ncbi:MAG: UDP-glucose--hexose-1-phosphate uridylyltransferase [Candidatus Sumerlaeia bacterium]|nr:UDP-glucose--hexose-1-phosphate uridylyltransferase [Candidatus Sumerlaeia bacterium]
MRFADTPHRRFNPLTGEWVLVSPHRLQRPWQGQREDVARESRPAHDPGCYLCPGNTRAGGVRNPDYAGTFVFDNDFPALLPEGAAEQSEESGLLIARTERGICRVVCFSPRHDLSLAGLDLSAIRGLVDTWTDEFRALAARDFVRYVQIFENKGEMMGCSNPHPHGQIWATETVPDEPAREDACQREHFARRGRTLIGEVLELECAHGERVVCANHSWVAWVPFWAKWPFETLLAPRRAVADMTLLDGPERDGLADILSRLTRCYDALFACLFPYTMGFHQAPTDGKAHPHWHLHAHFYPPLLRSATVRKFMVGFEMLATPQRDLTPEAAAGMLRARL